MKAIRCPFCGSTRVDVHEGATFRWRVVECECGATGPEVRHNTLADDQQAAEADSRRRAIEEWNRRT